MSICAYSQCDQLHKRPPVHTVLGEEEKVGNDRGKFGKRLKKGTFFCLLRKRKRISAVAAALSLFFLSLPSVCLTFILGTFNIISGYITADSSLSGQTEHANGSQLIMLSLLVAGANVTATKRMIMMMIPVVSTPVVIDGEGKAHHSTPRH